MSEKYLGIDTGMKNIGFSVIEGSGDDFKLAHSETLQLEIKHTARCRYAVAQATMALVQAHGPFTAFGWERTFFKAAQKQKAEVKLNTGAILGVLGYIPGKAYRPQDIKEAVTGYGRASKKQVADLVTVRLNLDPETAAGMTEHEMDAAGAALVTAMQYEWAEKTGSVFE